MSIPELYPPPHVEGVVTLQQTVVQLASNGAVVVCRVFIRCGDLL